MTKLDLQAIKERCEKATKGPWMVPSNFPDEVWGFSAHPMGEDVIAAPDIHVAAVKESDGPFIAHSREDIPALVEEVERLQQENEDLEMQILEMNEMEDCRND